MKSVLISINPKWCELIANSKKTIEVRKTRPKLDAPFICYIYQTKSIKNNGRTYSDSKVIGEFVCDKITKIKYDLIPLKKSFGYNIKFNIDINKTCLTSTEISDYLGEVIEIDKEDRVTYKFKNGYAWHISNLKIYDKPKELSEFNLKRPPQSWCYVESEV